MQKGLQLLIELQEIEKKAEAVHRRKARAPQQIAQLEEELRSAETQKVQQQEMLENTRKLRGQLEREVEDLERRITRSRQKLLEVKSNREYQALLKEIDDIQELIRDREDQILDRMERAERLQAALTEQEKVAERARQRLEKEGAELNKEQEKADTQIEELNRQKQELNSQIPERLLEQYQFLKAHRGGIAVAPVKHGTCQICHMNLPPQLYIDLQRDEQLLQCPACQRIIYWVGHKEYQQAQAMEEEN